MDQVQSFLDQFGVWALAALMAAVAIARKLLKLPATPALVQAATSKAQDEQQSPAPNAGNLEASIEGLKVSFNAKCDRFTDEVKRLVGGVAGETEGKP